jgi:hypothetical protein
MRFVRSRSLLLSAALLLGASLSAQVSLSVNSPVLQHDSSATISLSDPTRANQEVTVTITGGDPSKPEVQTVKILLNGNGVGSTKWWVPRWESAWICAQGVTGFCVIIL